MSRMIDVDALEQEIDRIYCKYLHPNDNHLFENPRGGQVVGDVARHFMKWVRKNGVDAVPVAECMKCAEKTYDCIVKLQEQIEQLARERNAAVADMKQYAYCPVCKHFKLRVSDEPCGSCRFARGSEDNWEWRGVQDETN